jgi:16S rRNA (cytosine967-C5)-methyltransferase
MIFDNQLRYATTIVRSYRGEIPLHNWLKEYFRENPQMGSRDRRFLSDLTYAYYRLGHAIRDQPIEDRIMAGLFLAGEQASPFLQHFHPDWDAAITRPLEEKINILREKIPSFEPVDIFPWKEELSGDIDHRAFCLSFLRQPDLFLRIRPGYEAMAIPVAESAGGAFIPPFTLRLPNRWKVEAHFTPDKEVVIQDYNSQRLASLLFPESPYLLVSKDPTAQNSVPAPANSMVTFWDACAASGGKSIMAFDLAPGLDITVSDIRESILQNLRRRFRQAGIEKYGAFVCDLTREDIPDPISGLAARSSQLPFSLILADVPCTGSGTWSRTPEQLFFFDPAQIGQYAERQQKIISRIAPRLAKGARLVYCTCSVFKGENEEIAGFIASLSGLQPDRMQVLKGDSLRADSMFAASFTA